MTLEQFDRVVVLAGAVLRTFSIAGFPEDTLAVLDALLSEVQTKTGTVPFIDAIIQLEEGLALYKRSLPSYGNNFNKARDPYKECLIKLRFSLINVRPYGPSKSMGLLSKIVGLPWP